MHTESAAFMVGFGRTNITPKEPVPLAGYGNTSLRFFQNIRDEISATCVAVSDTEGSTVLLFNLDLSILEDPVVNSIRESIEKTLGIPGNRVMVSTSHTHSGPDTTNVKEPSIGRYNAMLKDWCTEAGRLALADRQNAKLFYGSIEVPGMNFVKHYKHTTPEGETKYFGDNFGTHVMDETTRHATDADPTLHLVKFSREGSKEVVLANWRAHPHFTGGNKKYDLSGDYIGDFRKALENMLDCHAMFIQGCAGNINSSTRILSERRYTTSHSYGLALAASAAEGLEKHMTEANPGTIQTKQVFLSGKTNHTDDDKIEKARELVDMWMTTYDVRKVVNAGVPYGIRSPYHAVQIVNKFSLPETIAMELNAIAFGPDVAIVTGSEMFDTISVATEEGSPFSATITMGYCNAYRGYMPSKFGFEYTCYESDISRFMPGIAEQISDTFISMLKDLKGSTSGQE